MKWMNWLVTFALSTTVVMAAGAKSKEHQMAEHLKKELNLSDEQLEKIKEIRKGKKDDMGSSREKFWETKKAFKAAMNDPKSSREDLTAKFEAFQKQRDEFQRRRFAMMLEMREILSPEQMSKFCEMKKKHRGKHKKKGHWE